MQASGETWSLLSGAVLDSYHVVSLPQFIAAAQPDSLEKRLRGSLLEIIREHWSGCLVL